MADSLDRYHSKRRFDATPEPRGGRNARGKVAGPLHFVIQKHAASRLHYDFRLELNGSLKSWAVPKGPSLDPADKRMAVEVEDHPLDYADFEGTIPAGNYGAGTVIVWDRGEWIPLDDPAEAYAAGKIKFELHGSKLAGRWTLVRTQMRSGKQQSWLLIKERDEAARPIAEIDIVSAMPDSVLSGVFKKSVTRGQRSRKPVQPPRSKTASDPTGTPKKRAGKKPAPAPDTTALPVAARKAPQPLTLMPQLATLVDQTPAHGDWLYEIKFDGYRILTRINADGEVHLFTRSGNDWTKKMPALRKSLQQLQLRECWLDGEIIATDTSGIPSFQALQNMFEANAVQHLQYFIFDLPYFQGHDLGSVPLRERREILRTLIAASHAPALQFSENFEASSQHLLDKACALNLEGLIGKLADSGYHTGRSRDWVKLKCKQRQEFVIGGFTDSKAVGEHALGALLLGVHDADGKLRYVGKVGTGFTQQSLFSLRKKLRPLMADKSPFSANDPVGERAAHWVKPTLLAEIEFAAWTDGGHIRHASFQGLRSDKPPRAITREQPAMAKATSTSAISRKAAVPQASANTAGKNSVARSAPRRPSANAASQTPNSKDSSLGALKISHPERVVDARSAATKGDIAVFYQNISRWLLPHLHDRPVSLTRAPQGVDGELFFQKHKDSLRVPQLQELDPAILPGHPPLIAVNSPEALLGCVQMNVVEFHTWNAHIRHIEQPDRMLFDLDPGEGVGWNSIVDAALLMKAMLDKLKLRSFLKTSGGKGLHVVVPLTPGKDWDTVKDFSEAVARHMAVTLPQLFVAKSGPRNRINRIFIDYLRNGRAATTVAAFSLRARPGLGVSMPIAWEALHDIDSAAHWHIGNVDAEVAAHQMESWRAYASTRQSLTQAMRVLGFRTEH
jgi:bifunctional non-homologous end joining protein LigD